MPKLLYLSVHTSLEYEELQCFDKLGFEILSIGDFLIPSDPFSAHHKKSAYLSNTRKPLKFKTDSKLAKHFAQLNPWFTFSSVEKDVQAIQLDKKLLEPFDVIIVNHYHFFLTKIAQLISQHQKLIWRSIGQSFPALENVIGTIRSQVPMSIVRFSETEKNIANFCGEDGVIRAGVSPDEFSGWNGSDPSIMVVSRGLKKRSEGSPGMGDVCNYGVFKEIAKDYPTKLYGSDNEGIPQSVGSASFEALKKAYRDNQVYLNTGTKPGPYSLGFVEAWMTGTPVVSVGPELGTLKMSGMEFTFEIPRLIINGENGLATDSISEMKQFIHEILSNDSFRTKISENGRKSALSLFSREKITEDWKTFFSKIGVLHGNLPKD